MRLTQLRDVIAIADHGGLRAAARHLGLAQPALSRSIRELEHDVGASLFERQGRGMRLTLAGEAFIRRARVIQSEVQRSREEVGQIAGGGGGSVAMAMSTAAHVALLPTILAPFRARYPGARLQLVEGLLPMLAQDVLSGSLDFYVGPVIGTPLPRSFTVEPLFANDTIVFARRGHRLRNARSLAELAGAEWVGNAMSLDHKPELERILASQGLPAPVVLVEAPSALSTIMVAASSDLLAMLPRQWADHPMTRNMLTRIELAERLDAPGMVLVRRASLPLTPAADFMADLLRRAARAEDGKRPTARRGPPSA